ncbi:hypothetical protein FRC06_007896 [Ceratobasidium sp. 370]|nr:hypothetical protein FRC06_007896 [Ceratobasidium sp. 370]
MSLTPGDIVKSQLDNDSPDPDARPVMPEPTTPSVGALEASILLAIFVVRLRARIEEPPKDNSNGDDNADPEPLPESHPRHHGKKRAVRELSRSPTPGSTDHEPDPPTQQQTGEYTYVYETLDHDGLVKYAEERLCFDLRSKDTQTILALLRLAECQQASQVGPTQQPASIKFQSASPLQVGGGWHLESTPLGMGMSSPPCGAKRGSNAVDTSNESNKRPCIEPENNSATSSETEDEDEMTRLGPAHVAAEHIIRSCSGTLPLEPHPSLPGTRAPPPTCDVTPATVLASAAPS